MTGNNNTDESIDKAEFDERIDEIEEIDEAIEKQEASPDLLTFSDLLDMREDINTVSDSLDQSRGYWAEVVLVLEEQVEVALQKGENEKADALSETLDKARELARRIDDGDAISELRKEVKATNE